MSIVRVAEVQKLMLGSPLLLAARRQERAAALPSNTLFKLRFFIGCQ
jgi:hypothetical protein